MGTKIQANALLREYHSVIDLDGTASVGMRSLCNGNKILKNGPNPDPFTSRICKNGYLAGYDPEKVRQTILEHESVFRYQLQELHRLYGRQQELMKEIQRREINKDSRSLRSCEPLLSKSSIFPKGTFNLGNRNHQSYDRDTKLSLCSVQTSQHEADASRFNLLKRLDDPGDLSITNPTDGIPDRLTLSRIDSSANSFSNLNLVTKDFFKRSLDGMNGGRSLSILGLRNERSGNELMSDEYTEKRRLEKHSCVGDSCSGKSLAFPQSVLFAEPRNESRRKRKIFGVEISGGNDEPLVLDSKMSSAFSPKVGPSQENQHVVSFEPSSWIANSFVQSLGGSNINDCKNERSKADLTGEISNGNRFSYDSDTNRKQLEGYSSIGLNFVNEPYAESDGRKCFKNLDVMNSKPAEVLEKDSESSQKFQPIVPQHPVVLADCKNDQENPERGLPWFLRNSQVSGDLNKEKKSSYFMNLDSLQNCSEKFFKKAETAEGTFWTSMQKKEISGIGSDSDRKVENDEDIPKNQLENKDLALQKGLNNYISDLRHHIDLNLSLDKEDAPSAPSLPTAIVKIATTEIDLEAPAVIESDTDTSPKECTYEDCDKIAAEAIMALSLSERKNPVDEGAYEPPDVSIDCLEWFAEIISSNTLVEESIPDGMDFFEYMTLKLEDTKEEAYHYEPSLVLNNPSDDENGKAALSSKRSRRGRQRKDFQRDILPGLVTLSRVEVTEDLQAFEELLKAQGSTLKLSLSQRSSTRNSRGKRRSAGPNTSPTTKALCSALPKQPVCQLEERSLMGWGKRTRRLPRQRCNSAFLSFAVKC